MSGRGVTTVSSALFIASPGPHRCVKWALQLLVCFKNSITSTLHSVLWAAPLCRGQLLAENDSKDHGELLKVTSVESDILSEVSLLITWACWHSGSFAKEGVSLSFWTWVIFLAYKSNGNSQQDIFMCCCVYNMKSKLACMTDNPRWTGCLPGELAVSSCPSGLIPDIASFRDYILALLKLKLCCMPLWMCELSPFLSAISHHSGQMGLNHGAFPDAHFASSTESGLFLSSPLFLVYVLRERLLTDILGNAHASPLNSMVEIPLLLYPRD